MQWNHQGMELEFQPEMAWDHFHLFEDTPQWDTTFSAEEGFPKGTIFPQLYKPFCPGGERHA